MGNCVGGFGNRIRKRGRRIIPWKKQKSIVVCFIGLEGVGKTTIIKAFQGEDISTVHSTIGFSRAEFEVNGYKLIAYDLGGNERIRDIWSNYYSEIFGIVYVVDAAKESDMEENKRLLKEFQKIKQQLNRKPLLVLLNKSDLPGAMDELHFSDECELHKLAKEISGCIRIEQVSARRGIGKEVDPALVEAFEWFIEQIFNDYSEIEKGVQAAVKLLKERQDQEKLERQHRLAVLAARKAAESPDAPSTVIDEEENEPPDPETVINGNLADAANEIGENVGGFYEPRSEHEMEEIHSQTAQQPSTSSHHETASVSEPRNISRVQRILNFKKHQKVGPEPSSRTTPLSSVKESGVINEGFEMTAENVPKTTSPPPPSNANTINNSLPVVARQLPQPILTRNPTFSMEPNQGEFVEQLELQDMPYDGSQELDNTTTVVTVRSI